MTSAAPKIVSSDLGKLDARRHLISGPPCAKAGAAPAARMPAIPAPALPMNFLRSILTPPLLVSGTLRRREPTLFSRERHAIDEDGAAVLGAAHDGIAAHLAD